MVRPTDLFHLFRGYCIVQFSCMVSRAGQLSEELGRVCEQGADQQPGLAGDQHIQEHVTASDQSPSVKAAACTIPRATGANS